jgi:sugar lactone lactonase YvrE
MVTINNAQEVFISPKLEKVWEVSTGLDVPESSFYNKYDNTIYISNIVGKHNVKDGVGYISKVDINGKMIEKEWVTGLNAAKGICASKSKLYVTDIDRVLEIDIKTGKILKEYRNSKSVSLNDVTVATDDKVYISDSGGNCIFCIGKDSLEVFIEDASIKGMNGILFEDNLLYIGAQGNFLSINPKNKEITVLNKEVGYLDGIEKISNGLFVTSDWKGNVQIIETGKSIEKIIDTTPKSINAADLGYILSQKLLLVPTFSDNKVIAYKLNY